MKRGARETLSDMFPGVDGLWALATKAARLYDLSPSSIVTWIKKDELPRHAQMIAELYLGEVTLADLEDQVEGEVNG